MRVQKDLDKCLTTQLSGEYICSWYLYKCVLFCFLRTIASTVAAISNIGSYTSCHLIKTNY